MQSKFCFKNRLLWGQPEGVRGRRSEHMTLMTQKGGEKQNLKLEFSHWKTASLDQKRGK